MNASASAAKQSASSAASDALLITLARALLPVLILLPVR
ncbi:MAG: Hypothetical protein AJITA_00555 [Acetilactobacillus jinshanensis]